MTELPDDEQTVRYGRLPGEDHDDGHQLEDDEPFHIQLGKPGKQTRGKLTYKPGGYSKDEHKHLIRHLNTLSRRFEPYLEDDDDDEAMDVLVGLQRRINGMHSKLEQEHRKYQDRLTSEKKRKREAGQYRVYLKALNKLRGFIEKEKRELRDKG